MRNLLLLFAVCIFTSPLFSQEKKEKFDDIINLFIDEKYDKCFDRAYGYTQSEKDKRHPLPYVYCSMSAFEMSRSEEFMEQFPKALRDAMKYAVKFRKKDDKFKKKNPESDFLSEYEDYFTDLRKTMIEAAEGDFDGEAYTKALKYYKYLTGMDPNDHAAWFMKGLCEMKNRASSEALKTWAIAEKDFNGEATIEEMSDEQKTLMKFYLIRRSEYAIDSGDSGTAKELMEMGKNVFEHDKEFMSYYNDINS